jgi:hypothetical protein
VLQVDQVIIRHKVSLKGDQVSVTERLKQRA